MDAVPSAAAYDCQLAGELSSVPGDPTSNMLAAYNAGVYAVLQYNGVPPYPQTDAYVSRTLALEPSFAAGTGPVPTTSAVAAVALAQAEVGIPYQWDGNGGVEADGKFGCSGLTPAAYAISGISIPHNAAAQWSSGTHISPCPAPCDWTISRESSCVVTSSCKSCGPGFGLVHFRWW